MAKALFWLLLVIMFFSAVSVMAFDAPTVTAPGNGSDWSSSYEVEFEYTPPLASGTCTLIVDGQIENQNSSTVPMAVDHTYATLAAGSHAWLVSCVNASQLNQSASSGTYNLNLTYTSIENLSVTNVGQAGFESTNPEYTSIRTVLAELDYNNSATFCSYKNYDSPWNPYISRWSAWAECEPQKFWLLEADDGIKTVWARINHTNGLITYAYDTIILNTRGYGLDVTPPDAPIVTDDGAYTNDNSSLHFSWTKGYDRESDLLKIPLKYYFRIPDSDNYTDWTEVTNLSQITIGISLKEYTPNYTIEIMVSNSANLTNISESDGIVLDMTPPTKDSAVTTNYAGDWTRNNNVTFFWDGAFSDGAQGSGIAGYSFTISVSAGTVPDNVPDGPLSNLSSKLNHTFVQLPSGQYYFHLKAKDAAGNWGTGVNIEHSNVIQIDVTRPTIPKMTSAEATALGGKVRFNWTAATDYGHSGVVNYSLQLSQDPKFLGTNINFTLGNVLEYEADVTTDGVWYARVKAIDAAGNEGYFSDLYGQELDVTPPRFIYARPNGTVISNPVLRVQTNEQAVCSFNGTQFHFTNSTYHEDRSTFQEGNYPLLITCVDNAGLSNSTLIDFTYNSSYTPSSVVAIAQSSIYPYRKGTITLYVTGGGVPLGGVTKSRFKFSAEMTENEFVIDDLSNGLYELSFIAPNQSGQYGFNISVDALPIQQYLFNVSDLMLRMFFTSPSVVPVSNQYMSYSNLQGIKLGVATDSVYRSILSSSGQLALDFDSDQGTGYIFFTETPSLKSRSENLRDGDFLELYNPSFGYEISEMATIRAILSYPDIYISGSRTLPSGQYTFLVRNDGLDNQDRTVVSISLL